MGRPPGVSKRLLHCGGGAGSRPRAANNPSDDEKNHRRDCGGQRMRRVDAGRASRITRYECRPSLPKLHLNDDQREQIRQALLTKDTEVEFKLSTTKSAKDFTPKIGAMLPAVVKPDGLPSELTQQIPELADYGYSKMKDQILLVNELTGKIVEIISETPAPSYGVDVDSTPLQR